MSKEGQQEREIEKMVALGRRNLVLIPQVENWCKHVEIHDNSAGLITELYQIPTMLSIGCPHASGGYSGANFEWSARDFILENCKNCQFHKKISSPNFGEEVFRNYAEFLEQKKEEQQRIHQKRLELHEYITGLKKVYRSLILRNFLFIKLSSNFPLLIKRENLQNN